MGRRFDEAVEASWARFDERLTDALSLLEEDCHIAGPDADGDLRALVTFQRDDEWVMAHLAGNEESHDTNVVEALGWERQEDPGDTWWKFDVHRDELDLLVGMVPGTLRQVFGVADPAFLVDDLPEGDDDTGDVTLDESENPVVGFPETAGELRELVTAALGTVYDDLVCDDDGDWPIHTGVVPMWVQVDRATPVVRIFSYVVVSVRDVRQARLEVAILNRRTPLLKFRLEGDMVIASYELLAAPFVAPQFLHALDRVAELLNDLAGDAALRVRGRLWFEVANDTSQGEFA